MIRNVRLFLILLNTEVLQGLNQARIFNWVLLVVFIKNGKLVWKIKL